jgi:hypothetical protein
MSKAESASAEPASLAEATQPDVAPGAVDAEPKTGGDTADLDAGKDAKPSNEKKVPDGHIPEAAFKERLGREKAKREKLSADLAKAELNESKLRSLFEVAVAENERLTEQLRNGKPFDEQGEELQALKIQQRAMEMIKQRETEQQERLRQMQQDHEVEAIRVQLQTEVAQACEAFPLVGESEVKAELRKNPHAEVRAIAQAIHEKRMAIIAKQSSPTAAQPVPTTVGKPSGASKFQYGLGKKAIAAHLSASSAKG